MHLLQLTYFILRAGGKVAESHPVNKEGFVNIRHFHYAASLFAINQHSHGP